MVTAIMLALMTFAPASVYATEGESAAGAPAPSSDGLNSDGFNSDGVNSDGLNSDGLNSDGLNSDGLNSDGINSDDINSDENNHNQSFRSSSYVVLTDADKEAANTASTAINALAKTELTLDDAFAIASARSMYDALTPAQKSLVSSSTVAALQKAENSIFSAIKNSVDALPENISLKNEKEVAAVEAAYNALTESQKALIDSKTAEKLTQAASIVSNWRAYTDNVTAAKAKTKLVKVKVKGNKVIVKWRNNHKRDGFQIRYSTKKNFKSNVKTKTIKKAKASKTTIKGLKTGTKYYIQVRAYTNVTNEATNQTSKIYGKWSKAMKVKK